MKRIVGAALFGLGVLFLIVAIGLPLFVAPAVSQLPYDLGKSKSIAEASNARFMQIKKTGIDVEKGDLRTTVEVLPQAKLTQEKLKGDLKSKAMVWDVYQTVRRIDDNVEINAYSTELAIDRRTGAAAKWDEAWLEDGTGLPADYSGQVYKFPFNTEKKDYLVYDRDLRRARPAQFKEVMKVRGVEVYRFEQEIPEEQLTIAPDSLSALRSRFAPQAQGGRVIYSTTRTFWIEPTTGLYVDFRDQPRKEFVPDTGASTVLLDADFRYTPATVKDSAKRAGDSAKQIGIVRLWAPLALGVLGLLAMVLGVIFVLRGGRPEEQVQTGGGTVPKGPRSAADDDGTLADVVPPTSTDGSGVPNQRSSQERPARR
ncbi:DUF3068 domain-containing protein [Micromonospora sp. NPDC049679]|uniref:DUF3068 domain-containing protein n=1 Tax=Micromonospora sp. NPDC049679 TaxID=3155920 RepID=UPI003400C303